MIRFEGGPMNGKEFADIHPSTKSLNTHDLNPNTGAPIVHTYIRDARRKNVFVYDGPRQVRHP